MSERPAKGVRGFLIYQQDPANACTGGWVFRVYDETKQSFKDYALLAEDIQIEIVGGVYSLFELGAVNTLSWSSEYLNRGRKKPVNDP